MSKLEKMLAVAVQIISDVTGRDVESISQSLENCVEDAPSAFPAPRWYVDDWPGRVH